MNITYEPIYKVTLKVHGAIQRKRMSKAKVSELTGISPKALDRLCNADCRTVNLDYLEKIAKVLNLRSWNELIEFSSFNPEFLREQLLAVGSPFRADDVYKFVMECEKGCERFYVWTKLEALTYAAETLVEVMQKRKVDRTKIDNIARDYLNIDKLSDYVDLEESERHKRYQRVVKENSMTCYTCKYYQRTFDGHCNGKFYCNNEESENYYVPTDDCDTCDEWEEKDDE